MSKITEEQLKKVQKQQEDLGVILNQIGALEANKHSLLHKIAGINEEIEATKVELEEEYGSINIDLKTGGYTIIEKEDDGELAVVKSETKMDSVIRKISIGSDYKNDAMHYSVGQQVYGGHEIAYILFDDQDSSYNIHIKKNNEVLPWKKFNSHMAVSVEYDLEY